MHTVTASESTIIINKTRELYHEVGYYKTAAMLQNAYNNATEDDELLACQCLQYLLQYHLWQVGRQITVERAQQVYAAVTIH